MRDLYSTKFEIRPSRWVFVPSAVGRRYGHQVLRWINRRWRVPKHYYHFRKDGHVAAMRLHANSEYFLYFDLQAFFHSVTRAKVHRALRRVGFQQRLSWSIAQESTVVVPSHDGYRLPYGYIQSTMLATLVLHTSQLGSMLTSVKRSGARVSVYVDDIVISSTRKINFESMLNMFADTAKASNFQLGKRIIPHSNTQALGIKIEDNTLYLPDDVMQRFIERVIHEPYSSRSMATIAYAKTVNRDQGRHLELL
jgi:hypothetical protein